MEQQLEKENLENYKAESSNGGSRSRKKRRNSIVKSCIWLVVGLIVGIVLGIFISGNIFGENNKV